MIGPEFFSELKRRNVYKVGAAYAVVSWFLVQLASVLLPTFDAPNWAMRFFLILLAIGFPVALVLAWAFEITPEGIKRSTDVGPNESPTHHTGRKLTALIVTIGLLAVALFAFRFTKQSAPGARPDTSIAVLPFVNASGDPNQEYFSDGLSQELINGLAQIQELKVIARSSSFRFKGKVEDARAVGQALGVGNLLEGTVRKAGDRVRISVALVNAADGSQRWSDTYERELKDIFRIQEEIAREVADQLRLTLLGERVRSAVAQPSNQNLDAYNAYLQGDSFFAQFNPESTNRAVEFFKEAIRLDPRYPKAHASLAWAYCRLGFFSGAKGGPAFTQARAAAERALAFNPNLSLARSALAYVQMNLDWNLAAAEAELAQADRIAPRDATVKNTLANLRSYQRRREDALRLRREAIAFDPLNVTIQVNLASDLIVLQQLDEGEAIARKALQLQPNASQAHAQIARAHLERKQYDAALAEAKLEPSSMHRLTMIAMAEAARGDTAAAEQATQELIRAHAEDNPWRIAVVYAYRGDAERTFEWLERAVTARDPRIINTVTNPDLERYHSDPRFVAFCERAGLWL